MSKFNVLVKRNLKESIRDPLSIIFCIVFPIVMLILLQGIFSQMDYVPDNFKIEKYVVGICVFGYTFDMLIVAINIAGDKNTEFINRIYLAPIKKTTYLFSFLVSMMPVVLIQTVLFYAVSLFFGLPFSYRLILGIIYLIPSVIFYLSLGILFGVIARNGRQVGPICSIFVSISTMFGGVFMPIESLGTFAKILNFLPFSHTVDVSSGIFSNLGCVYPHVLWIFGYTVFVWLLVALIRKIKQ